MTTIALLPGDGIGSEILDGPVEHLRRLAAAGAPIRLTGPWPYGSSGWAATGSVLPQETLAACRQADVVLSGAVGTHPGVSADTCPTPERALIRLRHEFGLRVSLRTVRVPGADDVVIVRNITGGAYQAPEQQVESDGTTPAEDHLVLEPERIRELFVLAADAAGAAGPGRRAISVDKASVYATSRLWRRIAHESADGLGVDFADVNVDRAAYELVKLPELPAVIVTEGLFGDILSDVVCARAGSPALCGSATVNPDRPAGVGITALFEPAHGSSPHRTGSRRSNPTGAWLALVDLFAWCPDLSALGLHVQLRRALDRAIDEHAPTYDLAGPDEPVRDLDAFNADVLAALNASEPLFA